MLPRPDVDDLVLTLFVGDDGSDFFDEGWACRFDNDAGQHRAGRVLNDACDASRLCRNDRGKQHGESERSDDSVPFRYSFHLDPLIWAMCGQYRRLPLTIAVPYTRIS